MSDDMDCRALMMLDFPAEDGPFKIITVPELFGFNIFVCIPMKRIMAAKVVIYVKCLNNFMAFFLAFEVAGLDNYKVLLYFDASKI